MAAKRRPRGVLLVGSVPLEDARAVFSTAGEILGRHLGRIPDGETGVRTNWIQWQYPALESHPALEPDPETAPRRMPATADGRHTVREVRFLRMRADADPEALVFETGYADEAIRSYALFSELKREGRIPSHVRFQVSIPTTYAIAAAYISRDSQPGFAPGFERSLVAQVERICGRIAPEELAIQWDVCLEVLAWEGVVSGWQGPGWEGELRDATLDGVARLAAAVPDRVELGIHLCYGDPGHRHIVEPKDTQILTEMASGLSEKIARRIDWLHLPVPRERADPAYFAPLRDLRLRPDTHLYLGLVHFTDGVEGTERRIAPAFEVLDRFGIATECGFGRRPPETVGPLMEIHARCADPLD